MSLFLGLKKKIMRLKMNQRQLCCLTLLILQNLISQTKENQNTDCPSQHHQTTFRMKTFLMVQFRKLEINKSCSSKPKRLPLCLNLRSNQKRHIMSGHSSNLQTRRKLLIEQWICCYLQEIQSRRPGAHEGLQKPWIKCQILWIP